MSRHSKPSGGGGASAQLDSKSRQNEFFVHREGIDRDVITADICTYLGNDALVKPGIYRDEKTGQEHHGYFVTAYRNLTTAMIDDLKADSARWENERRKHQNSAVRYEGSNMQYHNRAQPSSSGGAQPRAPAYDTSSYSGGGAYPGHATPGYGGSSTYPAGSSGSYQQGYSSPAGYSSGGMDPRAGYSAGAARMGMQPSQVPGGAYQTTASSMAPVGQAPGVHYAVAEQPDYEMGNAPAYNPARATPYQQNPGYPAYGSNPGQPQAYPPGGQMTQPQDLYYGRGPGSGAYPPGSAAPSGYSAGVAAPGGVPYSPEPEYDTNPVSRASAASPSTQAQPSSSGPPERRERTSEYREHRGGEYRDSRDRDRRDRDRDDRHPEKRRHRN